MKKLLVLVLAAVLVTACDGNQTSGSVGSRRDRVIGGTLESGWVAVGALVQTDPYGSAYCTGTLVSAQWVLTAAHCVADSSPMPVNQILFYVGEQTPNGTGSYFPIERIELHPDFVSGEPANDLALLKLVSPVPAQVAMPVAVDRDPTSELQVGANVTFVGYGCSDGVAGTGEGIRRSVVLPVAAIEAEAFQAESSSTVGLCFGDSGAPGLLPSGAGWRLVGVTALIDAACQWSVQARIAPEASWIDGLLAADDCNLTPSLCPCAEACLQNGTCDAQVCSLLDCEGIIDCASACGDDVECVPGCIEEGSADGRAKYEAVALCLDDACSDASQADFVGCFEANCSAEYLACLPPDDCSLVGGDCGERACSVIIAGRTWCVETAGLAAGATCDASAFPYQCLDGFDCVDLGGGAACLKLCEDAADCIAGRCDRPGAEIGHCVCGDEELCNGADDDCDGETDEGCTENADAGIAADAGAAEGADAGSPDAGISGPAPEGEQTDGSGCGCSAPGSAPVSLAALVALLGVVPRRRS